MSIKKYLKRDYIRYKINEEIRYLFDNIPIKADMVNISEKGIMIRVKQIFCPGDRILVEIKDENNNWSSFNATVKHIYNVQYIGLEFNMDEFEKVDLSICIDNKLCNKFCKIRSI